MTETGRREEGERKETGRRYALAMLYLSLPDGVFQKAA
jgi:hypothetical protein